MSGAAVSLENVSKRFAATLALQSVSVQVAPGEVLVLLGENGAGKSTLIKILAGVYQPDEGSVSVAGLPQTFREPRDAIQAGVVLIPQDLQVFNQLTVAENICIGRVPSCLGFGFLPQVDRRRMRETAADALGRLGSDISPDAVLGRLSFAERQVVAISRALSQDAQVLILDEPTASLEAREVERLFAAVRSLKQKGTALIYITHRFHEIVQIADRCIVLRDGRVVGRHQAPNFDIAKIVLDMTGGAVVGAVERRAPLPSEPSIRTSVNGADLAVSRGEVVGVAGLIGSGASALVKSVFGAEGPRREALHTPGRRTTVSHPADAVAAKVGFVSGERSLGLFPALSVRDNIVLPHFDNLTRPFRLNQAAISAVVERLIRLLDIRPADPGALAGRLSGGNQQKMMFARWLVSSLDLLLLDDPTAGVDVAAKAQIHKLVEEFTASGGSVLVASSDMPELMAICDRLLVVRQARMVGEIRREGKFDEVRVRTMVGEA